MAEAVGVELRDCIAVFSDALMEASELIEEELEKFTAEASTVEVEGIRLPWTSVWYNIKEVELHLRGILLPSKGEESKEGVALMYCIFNALTANLYGFKDGEVSELRIRFLRVPLEKYRREYVNIRGEGL